MARDGRQEHDRQGRVSADGGDRVALRARSSPTSGTRRRARRRPAAPPLARARRRCWAGSRSSGAGASGCARPAGRPTDPNLVAGINVQVCWEKFCRYWDVEPRLVPMEGERYTLGAPRRPRTATRTRSASPRSSARPSTAATSRSRRSPRRSTRSSATRARRPDPRRRRLGRLRRSVPPARPRVGLPDPAGAVDQRIGSQVRPRLPGRRLGAVARSRRPAQGSRSSMSTTSAATCRRSRSTSRGREARSSPVPDVHEPRPRGLPPRTAALGRHRAPHRRGDRGDRPVHADQRRERSARLRVHAEARGHQLHGLRRLRPAARARLARPRLHLPRESRGPLRAADRRARRYDDEMGDLLLDLRITPGFWSHSTRPLPGPSEDVRKAFAH